MRFATMMEFLTVAALTPKKIVIVELWHDCGAGSGGTLSMFQE